MFAYPGRPCEQIRQYTYIAIAIAYIAIALPCSIAIALTYISVALTYNLHLRNYGKNLFYYQTGNL